MRRSKQKIYWRFALVRVETLHVGDWVNLSEDRGDMRPDWWRVYNITPSRFNPDGWWDIHVERPSQFENAMQHKMVEMMRYDLVNVQKEELVRNP